MRALLLLAAAGALTGCLGSDTVRAVLVEESFVLAPDAPPSALDRTSRSGCAPGVYDPESGTITFEPDERGLRPAFTMIWSSGGTHAALPARNNALLPALGSSGSWAMSGPWPDAPQGPELRWSGDGPTFDGEALPRGEMRAFSTRYNATWQNATFAVEHRFDVTYLGRVPYAERPLCSDA